MAVYVIGCEGSHLAVKADRTPKPKRGPKREFLASERALMEAKDKACQGDWETVPTP